MRAYVVHTYYTSKSKTVYYCNNGRPRIRLMQRYRLVTEYKLVDGDVIQLLETVKFAAHDDYPRWGVIIIVVV